MADVDTDKENVGGAPLPPKRPTVIRAAPPVPTEGPTKPPRFAPARPAPARLAPARPAPVRPAATAARPNSSAPSVPSPPAKAKETELPKGSPSDATGGSSSSAQPKTATGKRKIEITIVDARPMSEMGFRDIKAEVKSSPRKSPSPAPEMQAPVSSQSVPSSSSASSVPLRRPAARPPRPKSMPPPASAFSAAKPSPDSNTETQPAASQQKVPSSPPRPKRPTIIRPRHSKTATTPLENVPSTAPSVTVLDAEATPTLSQVPPSRPTKPSVIKRAQVNADGENANSFTTIEAARCAESPRSTLLDSEDDSSPSVPPLVPVRSAPLVKPTVIRPQPRVPPPETAESQSSASSGDGKSSESTVPITAGPLPSVPPPTKLSRPPRPNPPVLSPHNLQSQPGPKPRQRSSMIVTSELEPSSEKCASQEHRVSPLPSPRSGLSSKSSVKSRPKSEIAPSARKTSPRMPTTPRETFSSASPNESMEDNVYSTIGDTEKELRHNISNGSVKLEPTPLTEIQESANISNEDKSQSERKTVDLLAAAPQDAEPVYAKISRAKKSSSVTDERILTETDSKSPFNVKLRPTVPQSDGDVKMEDVAPAIPEKIFEKSTENSSDANPSKPPAVKPKPKLKPKPKPKPKPSIGVKPSGAVTSPGEAGTAKSDTGTPALFPLSPPSSESSDSSGVSPRETNQREAITTRISDGQNTDVVLRSKPSPSAKSDQNYDEESPEAAKPHSLPGNLLAMFERGGEPDEHEVIKPPPTAPRLPSKRPVTIIGTPSRPPVRPAAQSKTNAEEVVSAEPVSDETALRAPRVPSKRPVTIIGSRKGPQMPQVNVDTEPGESEEVSTAPTMPSLSQTTEQKGTRKALPTRPGPPSPRPPPASPREAETSVQSTDSPAHSDGVHAEIDTPSGPPSSPPDRPNGPPSSPPNRPSGPPSSPPKRPSGPPSGPPDIPSSLPAGSPDRSSGPPAGSPDKRTDPPSGPPERPSGPPSGPPERPRSPPSGPPERPSGPPSGPPKRPSGPPSGPLERPSGPPSGPPERPSGPPSSPPDIPSSLPAGSPDGGPDGGPPADSSDKPIDTPSGPPKRPSGPPASPPDRPSGPPSSPPDRPSGPSSRSPDRPSGPPVSPPSRPPNRLNDPPGRPSGPPNRPNGPPGRPSGPPARPPSVTSNSVKRRSHSSSSQGDSAIAAESKGKPPRPEPVASSAVPRGQSRFGGPHGAAVQVDEPHGIALYDYTASQSDELSFKEGDVVYLLHRVDDQWLQGRVGSMSGIFPQNFIDVQLPLPSGETSASSAVDGQKLAGEGFPSMDGDQGDNCNREDGLAGPRCRALYDFKGEAEGDLDIYVGDLIKILGYTDPNRDWVQGELHGHQGIFPRDFVEIIEDVPADKSSDFQVTEAEEGFETLHSMDRSDDPTPHFDAVSTAEDQKPSLALCTAKYDYLDAPPGDLEFAAGDVIEVLEFVDQDWLRGRLDGREGLFPCSFVSLDTEGDASTGDSNQETDQILVGVARFPFEASTDSDLSFKEGDIIEVEEFVDEGREWRWGRLDGKRGMFPAAFVELH